MRCFSIAFLIAVSGCASAPDGSSTPSAAALVTPIAPATANTAETTGEEIFVPPAGYSLRKGSGPIVYCTKITVLGSRFPKDDCRSRAELEELDFNSKRMRGEMDMRRSQCTSAGGCAGS